MHFLLLVLAFGSLAGFAPKSHRIQQAGKKFSKSEIHIARGDSVRFVNDDVVMHHAFSTAKGLAFNVKTQRPGTSATIPFLRRGTAEVRCAFHPGMRLTVVVK